MGARLLRDLKNGKDIHVPHSDIHYIPEMVKSIAEELAVDTFLDVEPCMFIYLNESSRAIALCSGLSLADHTYDREHSKFTVELEDDGGIDLYYGNRRLSSISHLKDVSGEIWYYHRGLMCKNYDGLLVTVTLILESLFHTISDETLNFIRKYRILSIQKIVKEIAESSVILGFRTDEYRMYRTGDIITDTVASAVDTLLDNFVKYIGR